MDPDRGRRSHPSVSVVYTPCRRFTAAPTGNTRKDVGDEAREAKGWFFSKKNKAKDEAKDQADQTSSWLGGKKEQVCCSRSAEAFCQPVIALPAAWYRRTCAVGCCGPCACLMTHRSQTKTGWRSC